MDFLVQSGDEVLSGYKTIEQSAANGEKCEQVWKNTQSSVQKI